MAPPSMVIYKLTSRRVLQNRKQEKGIQFSHTSRPQKHAEQMMALDYIANEAKRDDTSAWTITSPPIAVSPNLKKSPITGSQHLTTLNLNTVMFRLLIMNLSHIRHLIQFQHLFLMLCGVEKSIAMYLMDEQLIMSGDSPTGHMPTVNNIVYQDVLSLND
jgi:hypothetical protein